MKFLIWLVISSLVIMTFVYGGVIYGAIFSSGILKSAMVWHTVHTIALAIMALAVLVRAFGRMEVRKQHLKQAEADPYFKIPETSFGAEEDSTISKDYLEKVIATGNALIVGVGAFALPVTTYAVLLFFSIIPVTVAGVILLASAGLIFSGILALLFILAYYLHVVGVDTGNSG
jgi:hypothetical protein